MALGIIFQAHRGVCTEYPENTMAAFKGAIAQGYPIIELDPAVTADGIFVELLLLSQEAECTVYDLDECEMGKEDLSLEDMDYE